MISFKPKTLSNGYKTCKECGNVYITYDGSGCPACDPRRIQDRKTQAGYAKALEARIKAGSVRGKSKGKL